jgi:phosphatidylglycerophosphate synthase
VKTEGELWAESVLAELRRERFTPAAWRRFLHVSLARARRRRDERARAHRQVLMLAGIGTAAWASAALAGHAALAAAGACWWLLVLLMLDWHLGMLERPDGRPLDGIGSGNVLTLLRAGAIPLLAVLPPPGLGVALLAGGATDILDGPLARARDQASRLGIWLDGGVDGFFLGTAAVAAARHDLLAGWAAGAVLARYLLPWIAIAGAYFARARRPGREGYVSGRIPGLVLFAGLAFAVLHLPGATLLLTTGAAVGCATFAATVRRSWRPLTRPLPD